MTGCDVSIIIPARNEERLIAETVRHAVESCEEFQANGAECGQQSRWEVLIVDNNSSDRTVASLDGFQQHPAVRVVSCEAPGAACARNVGRSESVGRVLVFIDADTMIPRKMTAGLVRHCDGDSLKAGITWLGNYDGGIRSRMWWLFWNLVRCLPMARAKAMPAVMFCTAETFDRFGPFEEGIAIGEEWPILAGLYRVDRKLVVYERSLVARSSSRRMDRQAFGYSRTFLRYVWAILHRSGRINYTDRIR